MPRAKPDWAPGQDASAQHWVRQGERTFHSRDTQPTGTRQDGRASQARPNHFRRYDLSIQAESEVFFGARLTRRFLTGPVSARTTLVSGLGLGLAEARAALAAGAGDGCAEDRGSAAAADRAVAAPLAVAGPPGPVTAGPPAFPGDGPGPSPRPLERRCLSQAMSRPMTSNNQKANPTSALHSLSQTGVPPVGRGRLAAGAGRSGTATPSTSAYRGESARSPLAVSTR